VPGRRGCAGRGDDSELLGAGERWEASPLPLRRRGSVTASATKTGKRHRFRYRTGAGRGGGKEFAKDREDHGDPAVSHGRDLGWDVWRGVARFSGGPAGSGSAAAPQKPFAPRTECPQARLAERRFSCLASVTQTGTLGMHSPCQMWRRREKSGQTIGWTAREVGNSRGNELVYPPSTTARQACSHVPMTSTLQILQTFLQA
jgi:hypothetical protein